MDYKEIREILWSADVEDQFPPDSIVGQLAMPIARYLRNVDGEDFVKRTTPRFERFVVECYEAVEGKGCD